MRDGEPLQLRLDGLVVQLQEQFAESARLEEKIRSGISSLTVDA